MASKRSSTPQRATVIHAIRVQRRVIGALFLREMLTRYGRNNIGFLWLILEPMLFTVIITALWTATRAVHGSDIPIVAFALTGYSSILLWRNMPGRCIGALGSNQSLLFHRQVSLIDVYAARVLLELVGASTSFVVLGLAFSSIDLLKPPEDALQVLAGWLALAWFGAGLAFTLGSLSERFDVIEKMWPPTSYLLFPLSGAAFIVDALPEHFRQIVLIIPVLHAVEFIREGYFGSMIHAHYDMGYLLIWNMLLTFFGLSQIKLIGKDRSSE
jgi:ABC-type polysaccharide/polyol phosphate export permease